MTAMKDTKTLNLKAIRIDGGTQARAELSTETVTHYVEALADGAEFPPVVVFHDGAEHWLVDGFHRYFAYTQAGRASIPAEVHAGTVRAAILFACGTNNRHGLPRTNADKRKAVSTLLADAEWKTWSDREIARLCAVSNTFVSNFRASLSTVDSDAAPTTTGDGDKPDVRKRVDKHGNESEIKVGNIGRKAGGTPSGEAPAGDAKTATAPPAADKKPAAPPADDNAEAAHGGTDLATLIDDTQRELELAQAQIAAANADDLKAEAMKWRRIADVHQRRQGELMDSINVRERELTRMKGILDRIGRVVGEPDQAKLAAAVEKALRAAKVGA